MQRELPAVRKPLVLSVAVAFAEAGEFDTAKEIAEEDDEEKDKGRGKGK